MKILSLKIFKKTGASKESLHKPVLRVHFFWVVTLLIFIFGSLLGALIGYTFFRSVYNEDYKNEEQTLSDVSANINTDALKSSIERRDKFLNREFNIPADPSR